MSGIELAGLIVGTVGALARIAADLLVGRVTVEQAIKEMDLAVDEATTYLRAGGGLDRAIKDSDEALDKAIQDAQDDDPHP